MGSQLRLCFITSLVVGSSLACTPSLPPPLVTFPETVDIVNLNVDSPDPESNPSFGWPATAARPKGKFSRALAVDSQAGSRSVKVMCSYELVPSSSCPRVELLCNSEPEGMPFRLILSQDGSLVFSGSSIGSGDNKEHWALVEMNEEERNGDNFRETAPRSLQLGNPSADDPRWGAQLAWSKPDEESSGENIRPRRVGAPDREFNLLSADKQGVFVSIHQAHPEYETVFSALVTAGNLWAENAGAYQECAAQ